MEFTLWWKLPPPSIKAWPLCSSQWLKGHKVWLKPNALWAYKHARWKPCCCGIFCSRFHLILSPLKIILEMVFWTNLMLDLICTWLEKTRRFCRQVNKKIFSCFWTASTCVQRSSFIGWCSRLTYGNRGLDSRKSALKNETEQKPCFSLLFQQIYGDFVICFEKYVYFLASEDDEWVFLISKYHGQSLYAE